MTIFVIVPLSIVMGLGWSHLRQSLPLRQGTIAAPQLAQDVRIARDAQGVAHISARTDRDAFFAMGYAHAQDRMWQLELQRRIAQGRLSEVFGKSSVEQDIWFRTLGLERSARAAWATLSPEAKSSLQAYTDGINHWLGADPVLPVEFYVLGVKPEPWTVYDSLAWVKVFALNLGGNYRREIERLLVGQVVDRARLPALFADYPKNAATTIAALKPDQQRKIERFAQFQRTLESQLQIGGRYVGSNAWVVSGKLTGDGATLMANDPHLGLQIPSLWYMASIKGDRLDVSGATLVGLPVVIFGRNQSIAWGGTNLMADVQDLYFEQVQPDDNARYNVNGKWVAFDTRDELIRIKQDFPAVLRSPLKPLRIQVRSSRHGPVISDMFQVFDQPAALRWTALDADDSSYDAFLRLNYAHDWPSFQEALRHHVAPALSLVYADRAGNIGYLAAGRMPVRTAGDGRIPVPGWNDEHQWAGSIPFDQWPRSYNPQAGFLVSANNKPVGDDYPYLISHDFASPARADRITALLGKAAKAGKLDLDAMRRIQSDSHSEPAQKLLARLLQHKPNNDLQHRAFSYLRAWRGDMNADSQAATIFNVWIRQLRQRLLLDDLSGYWNKGRQSSFMRLVANDIDTASVLRLLSDSDGRWCDDQSTAAKESCDDAIDASLDAALLEVLKIRGDASMKSWAWGDVHETTYRHAPFSQVNVLRNVFQRRIGNGGSPDSINVATYTLEKSGYAQDFGAGFRQLIALAPHETRHLYMNSTGQSGNVMSRNYDDMIEPFRDVAYLPLTIARGPGSDVLLLKAKPPKPARQGGVR
jgi:penicillin amidase